MRIQSQESFDFFFADLETPGLGPREEEPLRTAKPIDHRRLLAMQGNEVGLPGDRETAEVADVFTDGQGTVDVQFGGHLGCEGVELFDQRLCALFEGGAVRWFPPIGEFARSVELRTLVVEAVADLVTDHRADGTVVGGLVALRVEKWRLEYRGREDDLVESGVVVGVDRLGRHEPLVAVDVDLADRLTHGAFDEGDTTLPSRANRFGAGERATVEVEVLVDELRGEERRVTGDDLPRQPVLPDFKVGVREESADGARETWLAKDHVVERSNGRLQSVVPDLEAHVAKKL